MRKLDDHTIGVLDRCAGRYAALFLANKGKQNQDWVMKEFYNFYYKDEFEYMVAATRKLLGPSALAVFNSRVASLEPRSDETFRALLEEKKPRGYVPQEGK